MELHYPPTLLLNADFRPLSYFPLSTWGWQDTVSAVVKDTVSVVAEYEDIIHSPSMEMFLPSVVALREYQPVQKAVAFTRFNIFLRDSFTCQYCGKEYQNGAHLTFDHVQARFRGGKTEWANIVAACQECNRSKGHGIGLKPQRVPFKPTVAYLAANGRKFPPRYLHETWMDFLYWDTPLDP